MEEEELKAAYSSDLRQAQCVVFRQRSWRSVFRFASLSDTFVEKAMVSAIAAVCTKHLQARMGWKIAIR
jgi:hypothetical protein